MNKIEVETKAEEYENSIRVSSRFTKEDELRKPLDIKEGMEYTFIPKPNNSNEAFERILKLEAQYRSEWYQKHLINTYPIINQRIINEEIFEIEKFITEAEQLTIKGAFENIDKIDNLQHTNKYQYEYLRLQNSYYQNNEFDHLLKVRIIEVYGRYVLFYNWLMTLKEKFAIPLLEVEESKTKSMIRQEFEQMDKNGYLYAFQNEVDFNVFLNLISDFFEYKQYILPTNTFILKRNCKTKLAKILGEIHRNLSEKPLKSDLEFFKIVKTLGHFKEETNLYKVLSR